MFLDLIIKYVNHTVIINLQNIFSTAELVKKDPSNKFCIFALQHSATFWLCSALDKAESDFLMCLP